MYVVVQHVTVLYSTVQNEADTDRRNERTVQYYTVQYCTNNHIAIPLLPQQATRESSYYYYYYEYCTIHHTHTDTDSHTIPGVNK
jgi:hypothetical protein